MRLGTYTTFDAPTKNIDEAIEWLKNEFYKIGGTVRKINNPHDFGKYPSFEVDFPSDIEGFDEDLEDMDDPENEKLAEKKDDWQEKADEIEKEYNKKFMQD